MRQTLGDAQLGRAGSWVVLDFRVGRNDWAGSDETKLMLGIPAWRRPLRPVEELHRPLTEEVLHHAVLEAVKRDHAEARTGCELCRHSFEASREFVQFTVHRNAQRLKALRCRVDLTPLRNDLRDA